MGVEAMAKLSLWGVSSSFMLPAENSLLNVTTRCWHPLSLSGPPACPSRKRQGTRKGCALCRPLVTTRSCFVFPYELKTNVSCCTYFRKVANKVAALDIILG